MESAVIAILESDWSVKINTHILHHSKKESKMDILTVRDLAKLLRIGINSAYALVRNGTIHSVRVGRQYRIPKYAVDVYLQKNSEHCA